MIDALRQRLTDARRASDLALGPSLAQRARAAMADPRKARKLRAWVDRLSHDEAEALLYDWQSWARPAQLPPRGAWRTWLLLTGRGWGKNRTAAEWIRARVATGEARQILIIGATYPEVHRYAVHGPSGLLAVHAPGERPEYKQMAKELHWRNGAVAYLATGEDEELRGGNYDTVWADELAIWRRGEALWNNLEFSTRQGDPRIVITTTPRPIVLLARVMLDESTVITLGASRENSDNLGPGVVDRWEHRYAGSDVAAQELEGAWVEQRSDAPFPMAAVDAARVHAPPPLDRVLVGVDPALTVTGDETGIVAVGSTSARPGEYWVLDDRSGHHTPAQWAHEATTMAALYDATIRIETNAGGDLVRERLSSLGSRVEYVSTSDNKRARLAALSVDYARGRVHHVGRLAGLEDQLAAWPSRCDDRLDAIALCLRHGGGGASSTIRMHRTRSL